MDFGGAFDQLADDEFWMAAATVFGGFLLPSVVANVVERTDTVSPPTEAYGIAVIVGNEMFVGERMLSVGGGVYTADALAQRFGLKETVTEMGV